LAFFFGCFPFYFLFFLSSFFFLAGLQGPTDLVPDHVGQGADELRGRVAVALEGLLVDHLADGEPEGCFEALEWGGC
jgi:hypothetical protein